MRSDLASGSIPHFSPVKPSRCAKAAMAEDIPLQTAQAVGTLFEPNMEALANLGPDLIIAGGRSAAQVQPLSKIAPTIDMTIARARANIATYGALFGKQNKAAELVADGAGAARGLPEPDPRGAWRCYAL